MAMELSLSVIITTKNEEKNKPYRGSSSARFLKSIKNQTYYPDRIEIIVVDNNSIDKTKGISLKYTDKVYNFGTERNARRNFGMMEVAKGKYVMYLDADMILSPTLIESCVYEIENDRNVVALYIPEIVLGNSFWSKVRRFRS